MLRFNSLSTATMGAALTISGITLALGESAIAASLREPQILLGVSKDKQCSAKSNGQPNCSLQSVFNDITTSGTITNAASEQISLALFNLSALNPTIPISFVAEIAGNARQNIFGIYDALNPSNRLPVFLGADSSGKQITLNINFNGTISVGSSSIRLTGTQFGFYLQNSQSGATFYSEDSRNSTQAQSLIYQGKGQQLSFGKINATFDPEDIILTFEDKKVGRTSDEDYNDLVVLVEGMLPTPKTTTNILTTPEPTSALGLGLISSLFAMFGRRNKTKA